MFEGYDSLLKGLGLEGLLGGGDMGVNIGDTGAGALPNIDNAINGATDLYGSLGKDVMPAMSPVAEIPGVTPTNITGGNWDGAGRMSQLEGLFDGRPAVDPSLTATEALPGSDIYGMLSRGTQGLGGLMGMYNSWQMMNIMNKNEARNQKGFDLANKRYDEAHDNVKSAFAV